MTEHLSFDEMEQYIGCRELNQQSIELAKRVNFHLCQCNECKKQYDLIKDIYENTRQYALNRGSQKTPLTSFILNIKNTVEIVVNQVYSQYLENDYSFDYPLALGSRGDSDEDYEPQRNVLVDEENGLNRIEYTEGKISIQLDAMDWKGDSLSICVIDNQGASIIKDEMNKNGAVYAKEFCVNSNSAYSIMIEDKN